MSRRSLGPVDKQAATRPAARARHGALCAGAYAKRWQSTLQKSAAWQRAHACSTSGRAPQAQQYRRGRAAGAAAGDAAISRKAKSRTRAFLTAETVQVTRNLRALGC